GHARTALDSLLLLLVAATALATALAAPRPCRRPGARLGGVAGVAGIVAGPVVVPTRGLIRLVVAVLLVVGRAARGVGRPHEGLGLFVVQDGFDSRGLRGVAVGVGLGRPRPLGLLLAGLDPGLAKDA